MPGLCVIRLRRHGAHATTVRPWRTNAICRKCGCCFRCTRRWCAGYLSSAGRFLNQVEKQHLAFSGKLITLEIGIRFLADFLAGDVYFKVHREGHNLDRCRTQFKLVESIERKRRRWKQCCSDRLETPLVVTHGGTANPAVRDAAREGWHDATMESRLWQKAAAGRSAGAFSVPFRRMKMETALNLEPEHEPVTCHLRCPIPTS